MRNDEDLEATLRQSGDPASAKRLLAALRDYAGERLSTDELPVHRIQLSLRNTYIDRALDEIEQHGRLPVAAADAELFAIVASAIDTLIVRDRRYVAEMVRDTDWSDVTPRVLAYATNKHGTNLKRHGWSVEDYFVEAYEQLVTFRRQYPYFRDEKLTITAWLCKVINSLISHDAEKNVSEGRLLSIVRRVDPESGADQCSEEHLPALPADDRAAEIAERKAAAFVAALPAELAAYAEERMDHPDVSANDHALALGVAVKDIRTMNKRLRRRRALWPKEME